MKITAEREKLLHAFQLAASVAPSRSPKPVLENVKLVVGDNDAVMMGTDLEMSIRVELSGIEVEAPGSVLLPCDRFGRILSESTDEKLKLENDGRNTTIHGQRSEFHLPSANPDEFPTVATFEEERYHELPARLFREIVRRTTFATETESSRYALGGVLLELGAEGLIAVATDGRRLAKQEGPATSVGGHESGETMTIVPTKAMQVLGRALAGNEENIRLAARDNDILVTSGKSTLTTRLVEGRYPRWRDVFPQFDDLTKIELTVGPILTPRLRKANSWSRL